MAERVVQTCCCCCARTFHPYAVTTCNICVILFVAELHINGNPLRTLHPLGDDFGPDLPLLFKPRNLISCFSGKLLPPDVRFYGYKMHQI